MFIGGCAGSTGGGMKVIRWLLLFRIAHHQTQRIFNPRRVQTMRLAGRVIDDDVQHLALVFFFVWLMIFLIASIVMSTMVEDVVTGVTSVAATLNNIGPGLAGVGPTQTYAPLPAMGKIVLIFCMVVGRLELWAILCLFAPGFWWTRRAR
jgi:trk system potassium uptake protein TrkH